MEKSLKNLALVLLLFCFNLSVFGQVEIGGINYKLNDETNTAEVTSKTDEYSGDIAIPASVKNNGKYYVVTGIRYEAFRDCSGLTSITIPNSVTSIGDYAFYNCSGLTSMTIPNSVTSIGDRAFYECSGLTSMTIPNSVTSIGDLAFYECSGLTSITIPNSVTSIGSSAFNGCAGTAYIYCNIPDVDYSVYGTFYSSKFSKIVLSNSVTSIGNYAFSSCKGLTSITIPNSVTIIGSSAFLGCSGLTSITIPNSVTSIGSSAFSGCSGLTSITIPNSVTSIGSSAFNNTAWYNNQPDGIVYAGSFLYDVKGNIASISEVKIKEGTKIICDCAFSGCKGLTSITIPNSVTSIGGSAFQNCIYEA